MITLNTYSPQYASASVRDLAPLVRNNPDWLVAQEEKRYADAIGQLAAFIHQNNVNLLLLAGPSASGKTTTSKQLEAALLGYSHRVYRISLDNFYRADKVVPLWEDGSPNFEAPESLDISFYQEKMSALFRTGHQDFPVFDFHTNRRGGETFSVEYDENTCLIIEGLHALNPLLLPKADFTARRVYISPHTRFLDGEKVLLSARQLRLTRRILRDVVLRGTSPEHTVQMWERVLRGEREYLQPYRQEADAHLNTAHLYEPFLYAKTFLELEKAWDQSSPTYAVAEPIFRSMERCAELGTISSIPKASLICEFYHS